MKKIIIFLVLLALLCPQFLSPSIAVSACSDWPVAKGNPARNSIAPDDCAPINNNLVKFWEYETKGSVYSHPIIADGKIFFASMDNYIYCLDARNSEFIWQTKVDSSPQISGGVYYNKIVYFACFNGYVVALDASNGNKLWAYKMAERSFGSPIVVTLSNKRTYLFASCGKTPEKDSGVKSKDGGIYCLDPASGKEIWKKIYKESGYECALAYANDRLYIGNDDGKFYCYNAQDGKTVWEYSFTNKNNSYEFDVVPCVVDGKVYAGNWNGYVYCLDAKTGKALWTYNTKKSVVTSPVVWDGKVYIGNDAGKLSCLEAKTGKSLWSFTAGGAIRDAYPTICKGLVYFGSQDKSMYCLDAKTGKKVWSYKTGDELHSAPVIWDKKLYFGSDDGRMYCFEGFVPRPTKIIINPEKTIINVGEKTQFTAKVLDQLDNEIKGLVYDWSVTKSDVGNVSSNGLFTGIAVGECEVVVSSSGLTASADAIVIDKNFTTSSPDDDCAWPKDGQNRENTGKSDVDCGMLTDKLKLLWKHDMKSPIFSDPIVSEGKVFAGSDEGMLVCLEINTGKEIWNYSIDDSMLTPCTTKDYVFAPFYNGKMVCLRKETGEEVWQFDFGIKTLSSPVAHSGLLFFGSGKFDFEKDTPKKDNAFFYCLNAATGQVVWKLSTFYEFSSTPVLHGNNIIISSRDGNLYCVEQTTGKKVWTATLRQALFWSSPVLYGNKVFINATDKSIYCFDVKTGKQLWKFSNSDYINQSCFLDGKLYFTDYMKNIICINAATGKKEFSMPMTAENTASPSIQSDGKLLLASNDGFVYMVDISKKEIIWKYETKDDIFTTPSIANGKLFVTSTDGKVYCFVPDLNEPEPPKENVKVVVVPKTAELQPGETARFMAKAFNEDDEEIKDAEFEWSCSDEDIGTIDQNGQFTAKSEGVCEVKAVYKDAFDTGKVTVVKFPEPESETCEWNFYRGNNTRTGVVPEGCAPRSDTLDKLWQFETGDDLYSSPTLANGFVYLGSDDMKVYCLEYHTGKLIWEYKTSGRVFSPAVAGGKVYAGSYDRSLYCLSAKDGKKIWQFETKGSIFSSPAAWENRVYIGSKDGNLYCVDTNTGKKLWNFETKDQIDASPAVWDGKVYFGSQDRNIYCLDAKTGAQIWKYATGYYITSSPTVADGKVFIGSDDKNMYCLNARTGEKIWIWQAETVFHYSSPAFYNGKLYVGAQDSRLYCVDASTGVPLWNYEVQGWVSSPAVCGRKLYFGCEDKKVYCLESETGKKLWDYKLDGTVSSPSISNGLMFVGSFDNKLYCFGVAK